MFGWEFPPNITGGLGTACYGIAKGLTSYPEIDLTFVLPFAQGAGGTGRLKLINAGEVELTANDIEIQRKIEDRIRAEMFKQASAYVSPERFEELLTKRLEKENVKEYSTGKLSFSGRYGTSLYEEISRFARVAKKVAKTEEHDIIHAHDWLTFEAGVAAKRVSGKPLVLHVHATEFDRTGEKYNPRVFQIEKHGMEMADRIITVSEFTRRIVVNRYGIDQKKVVTVHNAVEHSANKNETSFSHAFRDKIVTFLGRITYQKGPAYFVEAAKKVLGKMNNVHFVMAGTGDLTESMIRYVASQGISSRFHFTGFLNGDDVNKMYSMSDLYVMPSVSEPFGISPLEALQNGVPVIISKQSGVSEVINHAIKIDFWDVDAMADAIYAVLNYPALSQKLKKGKEETFNMKWTDTAEKIRNIYKELYSKVG